MLRYRGRVSGPLMDRIDLSIEVPAVAAAVLTRTAGEVEGEASARIRERGVAARALQQARQGCANARLAANAIDRFCMPDAQGSALLSQALSRMALSARSYHRVLKVARTIADLAGDASITSTHIAEALAYRRFDVQRVSR